MKHFIVARNSKLTEKKNPAQRQTLKKHLPQFSFCMLSFTASFLDLQPQRQFWFVFAALKEALGSLLS